MCRASEFRQKISWPFFNIDWKCGSYFFASIILSSKSMLHTPSREYCIGYTSFVTTKISPFFVEKKLPFNYTISNIKKAKSLRFQPQFSIVAANLTLFPSFRFCRKICLFSSFEMVDQDQIFYVLRERSVRQCVKKKLMFFVPLQSDGATSSMTIWQEREKRKIGFLTFLRGFCH